MAKKPTVTTVASGYYGRTALNDNFVALRDGFDNTLSLDGSTPNAMGADLDMNSNDILNAKDTRTSRLFVNGVQVSSTALVNNDAVAEVNTVADLLSDTDLTYTADQPRTVIAGDYVRTVSEVFVYAVAPSGATDQHVTTAGGVKLYVLREGGYYPFQAFGPAFDGSTNDAALVAFACDLGPVSFAGRGSCVIGADTTISNAILVDPGFVFSVSSGFTLTVNANIDAGNYEVFDGVGTVALDNSTPGYNLSWFKTANGYINERFDFAKRGMNTFRNKTIHIPSPRQGQAGVLNSSGRLFWQYNAPLVFTDAQNTSCVYIDGEFIAAGDCAAFLEFDDADKPESIFFYGKIQAQATSTQTVGVGIDIKAGERIQFFCNVLLNGFQTTVRVGSSAMTASVNNCYFPSLTASFFSANAVLIHGQSSSLTNQGNVFGKINAIAAQTAGLTAVKIVGLVRDLEIGSVNYGTDTPKNGFAAVDAENVVEIDGGISGLLMSHLYIGSIYQSVGTVALKIGSSISTTGLVRDVVVGRVFGKFGATAVSADYCSLVTIGDIENGSNVTIGSNASFVRVNSNAGLDDITDSGASTMINGTAKQTRGAFTPPAPAVPWPVGTLIRETGDDRVYLRVDDAGVAADFLLMRGRAIRSTTANRPTLGANDAGAIYFDTTLDADGKPIWWTGVAWVDATGLVV